MILRMTSLAAVISLFLYLTLNIITVGSPGGALEWLVLFLSFSFFTFLLKIKFSKYQIYIKFMFFPIILFLIWFYIRIAADTGDIEMLKQFSIATTGGTFLFLALGNLTALVYKILDIHSSNKSFKRILIFIIFLSGILLMMILLNFIPRIHNKYFVLRNLHGFYQRAGNFHSLFFILQSYAFVKLSYLIHKKKFIEKAFYSCIYIANGVTSIIIAQLMGSNNATVIVIGVLLLSIFCVHLYSRIGSVDISSFPLSKNLLSAGVKLIVKVLFISGILLLTFLMVDDFDLDKLRFFGYGGEMSSIKSRVDIIKESFLIQANYAPFLGNMNTSFYTVGSMGSYPHSFILYVQTHLGLLGTLLSSAIFISIFYVQIKKINSSLKEYNTKEFFERLYMFLLLVFVFTIANLATSVSWIVLWFTVGFAYIPISINKIFK